MSMLTDIKTALRITHSKLDNIIQDDIDAAKAEMIRAGVSESLVSAETPDPLIMKAIRTYCQGSYAIDPDTGEKFMNSFKYQVDCLRKSGDYNDE